MNKRSSRKLGTFFLRVPLSEKILFTKHLSMMVKSGMSEIESLRLIQSQIKSKAFRRMLDKVIGDLENGQFLSVALTPFKRVFGDLFINVIRLGEASGTLAENLEFLTQELKERQALRSRVRSALIYPIVILIATIGVTGALVFFVLPRILPIFSSLGVQLPLTTRILIGTANFLNAYYILVLVGAVLLVTAWSFLLRIPPVRYAYHRALLVTPFVSGIVKGYNMANITRTLHVLLRSGVKIVEALLTASDITANRVYKRALLATAEGVKRGEPMHEYLEKHPALFPPTVSRMIEVGERTGDLEGNLRYLADFYKNEVDETVKNLSSVLEPALLVIMGALVGFVAVSIITPIYEVTQTIGR